MRTEHLATLRQSLPRLWRLVPQMRPTYHLESVAEIDRAFLEAHGIRTVLWDVDGTLMRYHGSDVDPVFPHIRPLFREGSTRHAILSNCDERRYEALALIFPELPLLRGYSTDQGLVFRRRLGGTDTHTQNDVDRILAGGGRQIRKPSGDLVRYGMKVLEATDRMQVLMVGDQYLTDVASANLAGVRSAKVRTFCSRSFPLSIRASQILESLIYVIRHGGRRD